MNSNTQTQLKMAPTVASPTVHETRVDGVRTLWVEADPPFSAMLMFRVGVGDETLTTHGINHLVEHLALARLRPVTHPFNGAVSLDHTIFSAAGSQTDVVTFLHELAVNLTDLPLSRLDVEAQVLMAEAEQRRESIAPWMLVSRFGANGAGLLAYEEFGLRRVTACDVERHATRYFTAVNAVLALTGPPPQDLRLPLLRTGAAPVPSPSEYNNLPSAPTVLSTQPAGASLGVFGERSTALRIAAEVVYQRLEDRLRHDLGRVCSVAHEYLPLSADEAFVVWGADTNAEHAVEVSEVVVAELRDVVENGPSDEELRRIVAKATNVELFDASSLARAQLFQDAQASLLGHEQLDILAVMEDQRRLELGDIADALHAPFRRAVVILAPGADVGFATNRLVLDSPIDGRTYRQKWGKGRIVLGAGGVAHGLDGAWTALRADELRAAVHVSETQRVLIDTRGEWVAFDANDW